MYIKGGFKKAKAQSLINLFLFLDTYSCSCVGLQYYVADENEKDVLKIEGPACPGEIATGCCCSNKFTVSYY